MQMQVSLPISSWCKLVFSVAANGSGAGAVSKFTDKVSSKHKIQATEKSRFEAQNRLWLLHRVSGGR